jgi:tRNA wybutosine-synthesizing protein 1
MLTKERKEDFEKQQYRIVGNHSLVKVCSWTKQCLRGKGNCYKNTFYGIKTWRCVEMSPTYLCNQRCKFCWRDTDNFSGKKWTGGIIDDPKTIVDGCLYEWRKLLYGFGGSEITDKEKYKEVDKPLHFAISLTGEPTLYPKLPELIKEIHSRGISTFLVSNGTVPRMIERLLKEKTEPTQLYISLTGPNKEIYEKISRPLLKNSWEDIMKTLSIIHKFKRSVIRMTIVKNYNMKNIKEYAEIIKMAKPDFIEVKGYMHVGHSQKRLKQTDMPSHAEIQEFAKKIAKETKYHYFDEREESRVILLVKDLKKERKIKFSEKGLM